MLRVLVLSGFSLSLSQGIECLGFWFLENFLSSLGQGIECLGSWFSQGSLSSLSVFTGSGF
jgi:hypothetical protein